MSVVNTVTQAHLQVVQAIREVIHSDRFEGSLCELAHVSDNIAFARHRNMRFDVCIFGDTRIYLDVTCRSSESGVLIIMTDLLFSSKAKDCKGITVSHVGVRARHCDKAPSMVVEDIECFLEDVASTPFSDEDHFLHAICDEDSLSSLRVLIESILQKGRSNSSVWVSRFVGDRLIHYCTQYGSGNTTIYSGLPSITIEFLGGLSTLEIKIRSWNVGIDIKLNMSYQKSADEVIDTIVRTIKQLLDSKQGEFGAFT